MGKKRYHAKVMGRVQGVGYRYRTVMVAKEHEITGWVRNCEDGSVELEAQGNIKNLNKFFEEIGTSNWFVRVEHCEKGFRVEY